MAGKPEKKNTRLIDYIQTSHLQKKENIEVNYKSSNTYSKILSFTAYPQQKVTVGMQVSERVDWAVNKFT